MSRYSSKRSTSSKIKRTLKRPVKRLFGKLAARSDRFSLFYLNLRQGHRTARFNKYKTNELDPKLVVFECFMGRKYADSPKAIYEELLNNPKYEEYHFIWFFKDRCMDEYLFLEQNDRTQLILWGSPEYYEAYAKAKYWIANTRVPIPIEPGPDQVYVQCWHGTPLKRLGCDIETYGDGIVNNKDTTRRVFEQDAKKFKYLISPSGYCSEKLSSAFNLKGLGKEDAVIEEGYPRNDAICNATKEDVKRIRDDLGIPEGKKVILYAPTYREDQRQTNLGFVYEPPIDFNRLRERIGDGYVVLFRAHYYVANALNFDAYNGFVLNASDYPDINDLYVISDILITDYSSVFFDYGILKRPIIFYMYDLEFYRDELRGFYLSLEELPGPITTTQEELEEKLSGIGHWNETAEYKEMYDHFIQRFAPYDDGHSAYRVVRAIFGEQKNS